MPLARPSFEQEHCCVDLGFLLENASGLVFTWTLGKVGFLEGPLRADGLTVRVWEIGLYVFGLQSSGVRV